MSIAYIAIAVILQNLILISVKTQTVTRTHPDENWGNMHTGQLSDDIKQSWDWVLDLQKLLLIFVGVIATAVMALEIHTALDEMIRGLRFP